MVVASICEDKDVRRGYISLFLEKKAVERMGKVKRNVEEMERCREMVPIDKS